VPEQEVGHRGAAALSGRQQGILCVAAIEAESAAGHDAADLVVADAPDLAAELERMPAARPGEVFHQLDRRIVIDERRIALFTESGNA
jgi:hypothetical protein